jgi:hypothetical protein
LNFIESLGLAPLLMAEDTQQMHGVEVVGLRFENRCVTKCSLIELALLMQLEGLLEARGIDLLILEWHPLDNPCPSHICDRLAFPASLQRRGPNVFPGRRADLSK